MQTPANQVYWREFSRGASHEQARALALQEAQQWLQQQPGFRGLDPEEQTQLTRHLTATVDANLPSGLSLGLRGAGSTLSAPPSVWDLAAGLSGRGGGALSELVRGFTGHPKGGLEDVATDLGMTGGALWAASKVPLPPGWAGVATKALLMGLGAFLPSAVRRFRGQGPAQPPTPTPTLGQTAPTITPAPRPARLPKPAPTTPSQPTQPPPPQPTPAALPAAGGESAFRAPRYRLALQQLAVPPEIREQVKGLLQGRRVPPDAAAALEQSLLHLLDAQKVVQARLPKYLPAFRSGLAQTLAQTLKGGATAESWIGALIHELGPPGGIAANLIKRGGRLSKTRAQEMAEQLVKQAAPTTQPIPPQPQPAVPKTPQPKAAKKPAPKGKGGSAPK